MGVDVVGDDHDDDDYDEVIVDFIDAFDDDAVCRFNRGVCLLGFLL